MELDDICFLVSREITKNEYLQEVTKDVLKQVFCKRGNISRSEFFNGGRQGKKPEFMLTIAKMDYDKEDEIEYQGKRYAVYRTYEIDLDYIEVYCEEKGGVQ